MQENNEQSIELSKEDKVETTENNQLDGCQKELADWKDKYLHLSADFQNHKKRLKKEQASLTQLIKADMLREILLIVDNFERAMEAGTKEEEQSIEVWLKGFELIAKDLYKFLEKQGVKEIESIEPFDPERHEAVMQVESESHEPGAVVIVLQKGYLLNNHVLRPAKVSVAK